ncbi:hypothetical protein RBB50_000296 [Rhinocladiella similis]
MTATKSSQLQKIIIVGAGPSGLILALLLGQKGIKVDVLDASTKLDEQPRATHYNSPATHVLQRVGVLDEIRERGVISKRITWRKPDGELLAALDLDSIPEESPQRMVALPLNEVSQIVVRHLQSTPSVNIKWAHNVVDVGQNENAAWVDVETPGGKQRMEADYIIGCDGANSKVRRALQGDLNFPGKTWDEQIVATNVYYDFHQFGWDDANFIIHPEHWFMASRISKDGLWRVSYGEVPGLTREQYLERQPMKYETMLPGHPKPDQYRITNISPYKIHQRCAEKMRVGRFLLAADAAHLCNPFGGLGLTGGLADVDSLFDCLMGIHTGQADDSILDKYDEVRRDMWHKFIDVVSSDNIRRLNGQNPDNALENDPVLQKLKESEKNLELAAQIQLSGNMILRDFTQDYNASAVSV